MGVIMKIKMYNFRYQNSIQKITKEIIDFVANFAYPIILCWVAMFVMALCGVLHYLTMELCLIFLGVSAVFWINFCTKIYILL